MKPPAIKVEIIHIEGPLKGTIQEFFDPVIEIGRHPECHVCFPKDLNTISRRHAEIRREGNRFMAVDHSTNGTLVNGKSIQEIILKDGDVLTIGKNGPKISILTSIIKENELPPDLSQLQTASSLLPEVPARKHYPVEPDPIPSSADVLGQQPPLQNSVKQDTPARASTQSIQKPFIMQFGPKIKSFQTLPITLGRSPECDFAIEHPGVLAQHVQIYYDNNSYHIKDLTGRGLVTVNGKSLPGEAQLVSDTCISLSNTGPTFQFLGEGRLAEIETSPHTDVVRDDPVSHGNNYPAEKGKKKSFWPFTKK